jgi:tRNA 5-methylaminomethyl-2-thiouridine biosynthesis bifunctional protein
MKRLIPATLAFNSDGIPFSNNFDDVYHSADGGVGQARHVFLDGNRLPERWQGRNIFTIVETGFGMGLNFLATWQAFRADARRPARLHFVSVEKHPFASADLQELHKQWPEFDALSRELLLRWPPLISGFHRLHLDGNDVTLTLLFGDAADLLPKLQAKADAFFLDGFAPTKNPDLWSPSLFQNIAQLAAPDSTFATYTVASAVRDGLTAAGFIAQKIPGFGRKREMLAGHWNAGENVAKLRKANHAIVIGAGLSGTHCAERLAARGWTVEIIERHSQPALGASGNPSGVLHPILHMGETTNARLSRVAFLYAVRHLKALAEEQRGILWGGNGLLLLAPEPSVGLRLAQIIERHAFPSDLVRVVDAEEATHLAGLSIMSDGCWFPQGSWINPPSLCAANLERHAATVVRHMNTNTLRLEKTGNGQWRVYGENASPIAEAPVVILANAVDCASVAQANEIPLHPVRGQVTYLPDIPGKKLTMGITGEGYIAPMPTGGYCIGATFQHDDTEITPRITDHAENLAQLESLLPGFAAAFNPAMLKGRVAWRATTPDRLPIFGALQPGLCLATGLGARGLLWAPLGAELVAASLNDEPLPIERELVDAISPRRFDN